MMYFQGFGLAEYVGFAIVLFLLLILDAVLTNIVARAAGNLYYKVEALPWAKWIYKKFNSMFVALGAHILFNLVLMAIIVLLPIKASYIMFFLGIFFFRVWAVGYKAYIYGRGLL
jgi:hypothetical protein